MSLINYEGPCTVCGQRITWKPAEMPRDVAPTYIFSHVAMPKRVSRTAEMSMFEVSSKLHEINGKP